MPGAAPDIRPGDTILVYGHAGAHHLHGQLRHDKIVQVVSVSTWPGQPEWLHVGGRICRKDLTVRAGAPHTQLDVTGAERSIINLAGMWRLLHRPE